MMRRRVVLPVILVLLVSFGVVVPVAATSGDLEIGVDTTLSEDHHGRISITADNVTLDCDGHSVTGSGSGTGIDVGGRTGVTVKNCDVSGFRFGIAGGSTSSSTIEANHVHDNASPGEYSVGIGLWESSNNSISKNEVTGNGDVGITLSEDSDSNTVTGNTLTGNLRGGIGLWYSDHNLVIRNEVRANGDHGIAVGRSDSNRIEFNESIGNARAGIRLNEGANANVVIDNIAYENLEGISVMYDPSNLTSGNTFTRNDVYGNDEYGFWDCTHGTGGTGDAGTHNSYTENLCLGNGLVQSEPAGLCSSGHELIAVDSTTGEIAPLGQSVPAGSTVPTIEKIGLSTFTRVGIDVVWGGYLGGPSGADLLVYDRDNGWFQFRTVSTDGYTSPFWEASGTRGWSHVVPGDYNGDGIADLLFYRASDGLMRFYTITADGTFRAMTPVMYGNRGWTQMIPGDFDANGTDDLMWYRATDGLMRFYTVTPTGRFTPMTPVMYGNRNWDRIPSGDFDADGRDDLMYYRSTDGLYRFYTISATGRFTPISDVGYTTSGWEQVLAGQFNTDPGADLVFYKAGTIQAFGYSMTALIPITDQADIGDSQVLTVLDWGPIN